jgi:hypothetical protein
MYSQGPPGPTPVSRANATPAANPPSVTYTSRPLPSGDCGFDAYGSPCRCRSFWPSPQAVVLCACGHHACYHSHEKAPSYSSILTAKIAALERNISDLTGFVESVRTTSPPSRTQAMDFDDRIMEVEDRLRGVEVLSLGLEHRLDDLETREDMMENELDAIKDENTECSQDLGLASPAPTLAPSSPEMNQNVSERSTQSRPHVHKITLNPRSSKRTHDDNSGEQHGEPTSPGKRPRTDRCDKRES